MQQGISPPPWSLPQGNTLKLEQQHLCNEHVLDGQDSTFLLKTKPYLLVGGEDCPGLLHWEVVELEAIGTYIKATPVSCLSGSSDPLKKLLNCLRTPSFRSSCRPLPGQVKALAFFFYYLSFFFFSGVVVHPPTLSQLGVGGGGGGPLPLLFGGGVSSEKGGGEPSLPPSCGGGGGGPLPPELEDRSWHTPKIAIKNATLLGECFLGANSGYQHPTSLQDEPSKAKVQLKWGQHRPQWPFAAPTWRA